MKNDLQELKSLRNRRRQFNRELKKINEEFDDLLRNFHEVLFGYDWDDKNIHDILKKYRVFDEFHHIWLQFANRWNEDKKHVAKVNFLAFSEYAIEHHQKPIPQFTPFDEKIEDNPEIIISTIESK
jgi:hypothetical protein